ncbi:MAG: phosphodiester glycosidase family protein [Chitinophagaceae bacterium]|nr:phosphodiester glycosidase family protein [Chitinophagaceae bacterium]
MKKIIMGAVLLISAAPFCFAQVRWANVDSLYAPLPASVHIYKTTDSIEGRPSIAYYVIADLKDPKLDFTVDTTYRRRITPSEFYTRNHQPLLVVNCSFFSYETNSSVNVIMKEGKMVNYNLHTIPLRGKDTLTYYHPTRSALGISKRREADVAWLYSDSSDRYPVAFETDPVLLKDSFLITDKLRFYQPVALQKKDLKRDHVIHKRWKMRTVVGGGPVLLQGGTIRITNNEERLFTGKAVNDPEPRTAMGYTADDQLIILVVQGRFKGIAEGISLTKEAELFQQLGCVEALNLDGGGSSCLLINGKETIKPGTNGVQRPVPAVFLIKQK